MLGLLFNAINTNYEEACRGDIQQVRYIAKAEPNSFVSRI